MSQRGPITTADETAAGPQCAARTSGGAANPGRTGRAQTVPLGQIERPMMRAAQPTGPGRCCQKPLGIVA